MSHTEAFGDFSQLCAATRKETAQQPTVAKRVHADLPALRAAPPKGTSPTSKWTARFPAEAAICCNVLLAASGNGVLGCGVDRSGPYFFRVPPSSSAVCTSAAMAEFNLWLLGVPKNLCRMIP